jgi:hypothetical protein
LPHAGQPNLFHGVATWSYSLQKAQKGDLRRLFLPTLAIGNVKDLQENLLGFPHATGIKKHASG